MNREVLSRFLEGSDWKHRSYSGSESSAALIVLEEGSSLGAGQSWVGSGRTARHHSIARTITSPRQAGSTDGAPEADEDAVGKGGKARDLVEPAVCVCISRQSQRQ